MSGLGMYSGGNRRIVHSIISMMECFPTAHDQYHSTGHTGRLENNMENEKGTATRNILST